jgi:glycosyltransferase involved in cell wall biosynthesis
MQSNYLPKDAKYFFLTPSIKEGFGGLTNAMLKRGRLFYEMEDIKVNVLTFNYDPDYGDIREYLVNTDKVNGGINVRNIYEFYSGVTESSNEGVLVDREIEEPGCSIDPVEGKKAFRFYQNGLYVMYKSFERPDGRLKFIDYFNEHRSRTKREEFDKLGRIRKVTFMDLTLNIPRQELYYNPDGKCFLSKWFKVQKEKSVVERINWFNNEGIVGKIFKSDIEMQKYWIDSLLPGELSIPAYMIVDGRAMDSLILSLDKENIYKIFVKHSIHVRPPFDPNSVLRLGNRAVFSNVEKADAIVLLTEAQKRDVEVRFGERNNYFVIPHSLSRPEAFPSFKNRNPLNAVVVARYHEEKQLPHIINAFKKVIEKVPNATLELYGFGDEEDKLAGLIDELSLNNNVFLKGQTEQPDQVFAHAAFSLLTSKYEGFGLVILESLAQGCPVVAYDIKYGPSDMIIDGVNGKLIPNGEIDKLSDAMIGYFTNPALLEEASKEAYNSSLNFSDDLFIQRWGNLFHKVVEQSDRNNKIKKLDFMLNYSEWLDENLGVYRFGGTLTFQGEYPPNTDADCKIRWKVQNRETGEHIFLDSKSIVKDKKGEWAVNVEVPIFSMLADGGLEAGFWDVSIMVNWNNFFTEKRIGYKKSSSADSNKQIIKTPEKNYVYPYYTKPHGNLSFKIDGQLPLGIKYPRLRRLYRTLKNI